jgi:hypothetical protein
MLTTVLTFFGVLFVIQAAAAAVYTDGALFRENFESGTNDYSFNGKGVIDAGVFRASYPPSNDGSPRLVKRSTLNQSVTTATLSFDMKLHSKFEFVKGGKLHGLGGGTGTTAGADITPDGWSVRMMWRTNGVPQLYIYHQDRKDDYGDSFPVTTGFKFGKSTWYRIDIQVQMNSAVGSKDGSAVLFIDGVRQAEAPNLNLTGIQSVQIDQFQFSTFFGGHDSSWSPSTTQYIYFDNFVVTPGLTVTGTQGKECEITKGGIYSFSNKACCAKSCGSCGGSGCSNLSGGASNCCTGSIPNKCSNSSAPCKF